MQEDRNSLVRLAEKRPFRENKTGAAANESKPIKTVWGVFCVGQLGLYGNNNITSTVFDYIGWFNWKD